MPDFDLLTPEQLADLRDIIAAGGSPAMCELIAVRWPAPTGTRYYGSAEFHNMPVFGEGLTGRDITVDARLYRPSGYFTALKYTDEINDDTIPLELLDHDRELTGFFQTYGSGHQVEVYVYFPQIDALVSLWWGHLRPPQEGGRVVLSCSASSGFRNAQVSNPRRVLFAGCHSLHGSHFATQEEIDANRGCDWNLHLPGGTRGVAGSELLPPCPGDSRARCVMYLGDDLSFVAADTVVESIINKQTKGTDLFATSKGNETNLKNPVRVIFGFRVVRNLEVSAYTKQFNTNHPDMGFVRCLVPVGEGTNKSLKKCAVNDSVIGLMHLNTRLGELRQPATFFSPSVTNMSGTAHFFGVYGPVDPSTFNASNLRGQADVEGLDNIRVYSDEETFVEQYTTLRGWCLMEMFRNQRWGRGYLDLRFVIGDWIALAAWDAESAKYLTADGAAHTTKRSDFNAELNGRPASQQFSDVCLFGRYGRPFRHNGKVRVVPLRREVLDESIPVFTDQGPDANIVITEEGSQLFWSKIDEAELTNEIALTFEDAQHGNVERPLTFKDQRAQKAAARALGDTGVHVVPKPYSALGITNEGEAIRAGWMLLWLGEFDQGGTRNNLRVRLLTNVFETLNLRKYQLIKVVSPKIEGFTDPDGNPFVYFRVMERSRESDLYAWVECQAYSEAVYEEMEGAAVELPDPILYLDARNVAQAGGSEVVAFEEDGIHAYDLTDIEYAEYEGPRFESGPPADLRFSEAEGTLRGLRMPGTVNADLSLQGAFTIVFVVETDANGNAAAFVFAMQDTGGNGGWSVKLNESSPGNFQVAFETYDYAGIGLLFGWYSAEYSNAVAQKLVVTLVCDGAALTGYVNSAEAGTSFNYATSGTEYQAPPVVTDVDASFGAHPVFAEASNLTGKLPLFAVYGEALTGEERASLEGNASDNWINETPTDPPTGGGESSSAPPGDPALTLGQETVAGTLGPEVTIHAVIEFPTYGKPLRATVYVTPPGGVEVDAGLGEISPPVNSPFATFDYTGAALGLYTFRVEIETAEDVPVAGGEVTESITAAFPEREQAAPAAFAISVTVAGLIDFKITPPAAGPTPARYQVSKTDDAEPDPADIVYEGPDTTPQEPYTPPLVTPVTRYARAIDAFGNKSEWVEAEYDDDPPTTGGSLRVREGDALRTGDESGVTKIMVRGGHVAAGEAGEAIISRVGPRTQDEWIYQLYQGALARDPDGDEYAAANSTLNTARVSGSEFKTKMQEIGAAVFALAEFTTLTLTDAEFVERLYEALLNGPSDPPGLTYWTGRLAGGLTRDNAPGEFVLSPEFSIVVFMVLGFDPTDPPLPEIATAEGAAADAHTAGGAWELVEGMSVTIIVPAGETGAAECQATIEFAAALASNCRLGFSLDGAAPSDYYLHKDSCHVHDVLEGLAAGEHTVALMWHDDGTGVYATFTGKRRLTVMLAQTARRARLLLEEGGGWLWPEGGNIILE